MVKTLTTFAFVCALAAPAAADTLSNQRLTAIDAAFDMSLTDPERHTDRFSPARLLLVHQAYDSHRPATEVDRLSYARFVAVKKAYKTHDPEVQILASGQ